MELILQADPCCVSSVKLTPSVQRLQQQKPRHTPQRTESFAQADGAGSAKYFVCHVLALLCSPEPYATLVRMPYENQ